MEHVEKATESTTADHALSSTLRRLAAEHPDWIHIRAAIVAVATAAETSLSTPVLASGAS